METFKISDLSFCYPTADRNALCNINLTVNSGEFVVLCGKSGSGKSTLLRNLKPTLAPHGKLNGSIYFCGKELPELTQREQAQKIGYVMQNPENQAVCDKVWHELAFGLENLGVDSNSIQIRVAEMASFFGITEWFMKDVSQLSGGQKQLLSLASVMAMQPEVLILDEPTSQLDPIAASEFLEAIRKINSELSTTVILSEHRLEQVLPLADRVVIMDEGKIAVADSPRKAAERLKAVDNGMFAAMPSAIQIYSGIDSTVECPLTVREGRQFLNELLYGFTPVKAEFEDIDYSSKPDAVTVKNAWFRYDKNGKDVIKDLSLNVKQATIHAIVGGNGAGKTTALSLISGINRPYRGKISIFGKDIKKCSPDELYKSNLGVLPQNPQTLFVKSTVADDLADILSDSKMSDTDKSAKINEAVEAVEIENLLKQHPYDLSGGEQQRAALAKVLLLDPKLLILDEPTKGLDAGFKMKLAEILNKLKNRGVTVLIVSHDIEFCSKYADICSMFFDGSVVTTKSTHKFFGGNSFYTTAANRISRHIFDGAITEQEVIELCKATIRQK